MTSAAAPKRSDVAVDVVTVDEPHVRLTPEDAARAARQMTGHTVIAARATLRFGPGRTYEPLARVLDRAVAEAHTAGMDVSQLVIAGATVEACDDIVRVRRAGYGIADWIRSPACRVRVVLAREGAEIPDATVEGRQDRQGHVDESLGRTDVLDARGPAVREALMEVIDPDLGVNVVDLGFVRGVAIRDDRLTLTMTLTSPACPLRENLEAQVRDVIEKLPDVVFSHIDWQWNPAWHPSDVTTDGAEQLRAIGFSI